MHGTLLCTLLATAQTSENITSLNDFYQEGQSLFQQKAACSCHPTVASIRAPDRCRRQAPACRRRTNGSRVYAGMCCLHELKDLKSLGQIAGLSG